MAKARAICQCATCGKEFELTTIKINTREATRWEEWASKNCDECSECRNARIECERAEASEMAANAASERGWPSLVGSEKQVAWANRIREEEITPLFDRIKPEFREILVECVNEFMGDHTMAAWWIDNQHYSKASRAIMDMVSQAIKHPEQHELKTQEKEAEESAKSDTATIAQPENKTHDGIVEISAPEDMVAVTYRKDDDFRALVKDLGYSWDADKGRWILKITVKTGTSAERAAELGNRLLNSGFAIRIQNAETLANAVNGNYEPMTSRWVARITGTNDFIITWSKEDSYYDRAKRLPGARYDRPGIRVPGKEYEAVLDFADTYGFRLTPGAHELIDELTASTRVVSPAPVKEPTYNEHQLSDVLASSREIIEDLKDN